jgi:hypothetical protein
VAGSTIVVRECIAENIALTVAREILALDQDAFSARCRTSPMTRARLAGHTWTSVAVLANKHERERKVESPNQRRLIKNTARRPSFMWQSTHAQCC